MFTHKGIIDFITEGFRKTNQKQKDFDSELEQTSKRIEAGRKHMEERSKNRKLIRNK
ncbi:hypothetical protein PM3016_5415 [Paenibacillus mucilaginosus 3016]|uniref:Uncharacterized protein n=1 Tax=Paenibacillus mucilaginosus 3016 TaxID=1116391 RepID=H6NDR6_9BACL|nr:hypothetical protein [Paenibacillus mucilaginosus]AFC32115.1 hypothetical protein PM3016_5415 [Paenibacillus mucilaginosus 3016]